MRIGDDCNSCEERSRRRRRNRPAAASSAVADVVGRIFRFLLFLSVLAGQQECVRSLSNTNRGEGGGRRPPARPSSFEQHQQLRHPPKTSSSTRRRTVPSATEALAEASRTRKNNSKVLKLQRRSGGRQRQQRQRQRLRDEDDEKKTAKTRRKLRFSEMYDRLKQFRERHGHCWVTESNCDGDRELHKWTLSVRHNYRHQVAMVGEGDGDGRESKVDGKGKSKSKNKRPKLSESKMAMLQELGFPWDVQSARWERRYEELVEFRAKYGHTNVAANSVEYPGLGVWVRNQKREHRRLMAATAATNGDGDGESGEFERSTLTPERLEALERLNFTWFRSHDEAWRMRYDELVDFVKEHGHANVPEDYPPNRPLGNWVMNQRTAFRENSTALTVERRKLLEEVGFDWSYREARWTSMRNRLRSFYEEHGHVDIPTSDDEYQDLRLWLNLQRFFYNNHYVGSDNVESDSYNDGGDGNYVEISSQARPYPTTATLRREAPSSSGRMTEVRIRSLEEAVPNFSWKRRGHKKSGGPDREDWQKLFDAMRAKGISPETRPKQHWFEGTNPLTLEVKSTWTEEELLDLWNRDDGDDDDEDD